MGLPPQNARTAGGQKSLTRPPEGTGPSIPKSARSSRALVVNFTVALRAHAGGRRRRRRVRSGGGAVASLVRGRADAGLDFYERLERRLPELAVGGVVEAKVEAAVGGDERQVAVRLLRLSGAPQDLRALAVRYVRDARELDTLDRRALAFPRQVPKRLGREGPSRATRERRKTRMKRYMSPWTRESWKRFFVGRPDRNGCLRTVT